MAEISFALVLEIDLYDYLPLDESEGENFNITLDGFLEANRISKFEKLESGFNLFYINSIDEKGLELILNNHLVDVGLNDDDDEQIISLSGGLILKIDEVPVIVPSCCGNLSSISEWNGVLTVSAKNWTQIWIGHPWIYYRVIEDIVEFSNYYERNIDSVEEVKISARMKISDFSNQMNHIENDIFDLRNRVEKILMDNGYSNHKVISNTIVSS